MTSIALSLWLGFGIGIIFGVTGQVTGFCLMRGLSGYWLGTGGSKLSSFVLALSIAIFTTQVAAVLGFVDLSRSIYLGPGSSWLLLVVGGMLFGYGMVAANGCGARALVLFAQGNLRSFVVLMCLGVAALATLTGLLAPIRAGIGAFSVLPAGDLSVPDVVSYLQVPGAYARLAPTLMVSAVLVAFAFADPDFRASPLDIAGGVIVGLLIPAGWLATGWFGADDFDPSPVVSLTFVAPVGEAIQYAMIATGMKMTFGIAVVTGVLLGALGAGIATNGLQLQGFSSPRLMLRYMAGGALMGVGGALALGCSIGQGLSGLSTLALGSVLATGGIVFGSRLATIGPLRFASV